jgi:hypothetical protein
MRLAVIAAGLLFASAGIVPANSLNSHTPVQLAQTQPNQKQTPQPEQKNVQDEKKKQNMAPKAAPQKTAPPAAQKKKDETVTQKVKRVWRNWTTPSHSFCVRCPIPIPLTSKVCTAKGKTAEAARTTCVQQNPLCYVSAGKC